jgi:hypothetical protein
MISRDDLLTHAREYRALRPGASARSLRTHLWQYIEDHDWVRKLPRDSATSGNEAGCLLAILAWPVVTVRTLFTSRRYTRMIEDVIAAVQAEPPPP